MSGNNGSVNMAGKIFKPKVELKDRCFKCGSYNLYIKRDSTWPSLMCSECGAYVRDFGD
jgi:hypothetical protein